MTTATAASLTRQHEPRPLLSTHAWLWLGVLGGLFIALFGPDYLIRMGRIAWREPDWSHAMLVPVISAYYIYLNRQRLMQIPARVCWWGLPVMLVGIFSYAFWIYPGRNDMFKGYSMILALLGLVWFVLGSGQLRILWFPVVYLAFGVKVSDRIWADIAAKLQLVAAESATIALKFFAAILPSFKDAANRGSTIDLTFTQYTASGTPQLITESMNVAEACAGLRMLMAFLALGVAVAFLFRRPWWQRLVIVASTVPVAVGVNVARVTVLGLVYLVDKEMAAGDFHTLIGMLMLIPALGIFMLIGWILEHIMVRDDGDASQDAADVAAAPAPQAVGSPAVSGGLLAAAAGLGVLVGAAAAAVYLGMNTMSPPTINLPLVPAILEQVGFKLGWVLLPPAIVGFGIAFAGWKLIARRGGDGTGRLAGVTLAAALAAGVLGASAAAQAGVVQVLNWTIHKQPVPLQDHLYKLPRDLGNWEMVREDPPLPKEIEDELGTTQYISRWYRDRTMGENEPGALARLHVAYYTGTPDAVPHVPERCFTAGGAQHMGKTTDWILVDAPDYVVEPMPGGETRVTAWSRLGEVTIPSKQIEVTTFTYGNIGATAGGGGAPSNVVYFFAANGKFLATPEQIRALAFDPTDQYSYYCKIELQWMGIEDPQFARERSEAFLSAALPDVMALLPDWTDVREGRWPVEGQGVYPAGVK